METQIDKKLLTADSISREADSVFISQPGERTRYFFAKMHQMNPSEKRFVKKNSIN